MASSQNELRIVLIGRTGNGKSATGNSLLHSRTAFHSSQSSRSITRDCKKQTATCIDINGIQKRLIVVDTPGFFDTDKSITNDTVKNKIASEIFEMTSPGVHAFLIILRIGRFSPEEKDTVDFIKQIFGNGASKYCIPIFTYKDQLDEGQTIDDFIKDSDELKDLVRNCGNRKFTINNKLDGQKLENQTKTLLQMIDQMVRNNNGNYYTNAEYQRIERQRREEQERREEEERRKKREYEESLKAKAREEEQRMAKQREEKLQQEAKRREDELKQEAKRREDELRREIQRRENELSDRTRESYSRRDYSNDISGMSSLFSQLMGGGYGAPSPAPIMHSMSTRPSSALSSNSRGGGGTFTGEFMTSSGSANGRPIMEGSRGGLFYWNANGNKTYLRK